MTDSLILKKICNVSTLSMHIYKYLLFCVHRDIYDVVEAGQ